MWSHIHFFYVWYCFCPTIQLFTIMTINFNRNSLKEEKLLDYFTRQILCIISDIKCDQENVLIYRTTRYVPKHVVVKYVFFLFFNNKNFSLKHVGKIIVWRICVCHVMLFTFTKTTHSSLQRKTYYYNPFVELQKLSFFR